MYSYETKKVENPEGPLFHITPKNKLLKIKRKGLSPRKSSKLYDVDDPRIYFIENTSKGRSQLQIVMRQLSLYVPDNPPFGDDMTYLLVDPKKVDNDLYKDSEVPGGWALFTRNNIHPSSIKNWGEHKKI